MGGSAISDQRYSPEFKDEAVRQINDLIRLAELGATFEQRADGFYDGLLQRGEPPSRGDAPAPILMERFDTPLGPMFVAATERSVCLLEFTDRRMLETELADLQTRLKTRIEYGSNAHTGQARRELAEYFAGERKRFGVALDTPGTNFQRRVWSALQTIAFGQTASYAEQAERIGQPNAVRAVARANGMNRIAIVVPCHRVIGKDGSLTGYAGGLERKRWLLQHEGSTRFGDAPSGR